MRTATKNNRRKPVVTPQRPDRPDADLRGIALDIRGGRVVTNAQVPEDLWHMVFIPVAMMRREDARKMMRVGKDTYYVVMGNMADSFPMGINGYPMFQKVAWLSKSEWTKIKGYVQELEQWESSTRVVGKNIEAVFPGGGGAEHQRAIDRPLDSRPSGRAPRASNTRTQKRDK